MSEHTGTTTEGESAHRAGLFDIRMIIGALIGIYGVVVVLTGLIGSDAAVKNAGTINLLCGLGMVVAGALFIVWARVRPIVVPEEPTEDSADDGRPPHGH